MKSQRDLMVINDDKAKLQLHNDDKNDSKSKSTTSQQQQQQQQYQDSDLILNSISISIVHFIKVIFSKINGIVMTNAKHSTNVKTSLFVFLFFSLVVMSSSRKIPVHQLESFCR